jgi:hypothetical protein
MLAASGCSASSSSKSLSRAELIAKADPICARVNARLNSTEIDDQQEIGQLIPPLAVFERMAVAELTELNPPTNLTNDWKQIVVGMRTQAEDMAKYGEYAKSKNMKMANDVLTAGQRTLEQSTATAKHDGFNDCARMG